MFFKTILILSVYFLTVDSNKLIFKAEKLYKTCHFNKVDFWKFYYWMFQNYNHMHIATFEMEHESAILRRFLNEILASVADHGLLQKSFTVNNYVLPENEMDERRRYCPDAIKPINSGINGSESLEEERRLNRLCQDDKIEYAECPPVANTTAKIQFVTLEEILAEVMAKVKPRNESDIQQRIRSFSSDQNYRFFILVQNEDDLKLHLQTHWRDVFPNPRAIFVIMFVTADEIPQERITDLFERLWQDYDVFNLIITQPCVCDYKTLYTYDPYYKENGTWGLLKKFKVDDGINNPENYRRSLVSLNDYPLKISLFPKIPTSVNRFSKALGENPIYQDLEKSLGYVGLDGMILKTLAELLKLTPEMASQDNDFGYEMDGKYYGNLAEVVNRSIDISFNSRFVEGVGLDVIEYLSPVLNDRFCIIVPKASEIPQYLTIFQCFTWRSWLIIFMIYLSSSFYWFLVRPIEFNPEKRNDKEFISSYIEVFCLFLSVPMILWVEKNHQRVFFVSCMIFNIVVIGCFQGTLVKSFSTTSFYSDINTLEDFEKSGLYIISSSQGVHNLFGDDGSVFFKTLSQRIKIMPKLTNIFKRIATQRDVASVDRFADAILKIEMNYKTKHGSLIHIAKECPRSYHYTYIVPKGSPYVHVFNIIITVLREAGLLLKWTADITQALIVEKKYKHKNTEEEPPNMEQPFSMDDMRFSFYVIIGGNSLSIVVFISEVIYNTKCFKKLQKCDGCRMCKRTVDKKISEKNRKKRKKNGKKLLDGNDLKKNSKSDLNKRLFKKIIIKTNRKEKIKKDKRIVKRNRLFKRNVLKTINKKENLTKTSDTDKMNDAEKDLNNENKALENIKEKKISVNVKTEISEKNNSKDNRTVSNVTKNFKNKGILKKINFKDNGNAKDDKVVKKISFKDKAVVRGGGKIGGFFRRNRRILNDGSDDKNRGIPKKKTIFGRITKIRRGNEKVSNKERESSRNDFKDINFGKKSFDVEKLRVDGNFGRRILPEYDFAKRNFPGNNLPKYNFVNKKKGFAGNQKRTEKENLNKNGEDSDDFGFGEYLP